jgi:transposase
MFRGVRGQYPSPNWREVRRLRTLELKERGCKRSEIAQALGVSEGAVIQWIKRATDEGSEALRHKSLLLERPLA